MPHFVHLRLEIGQLPAKTGTFVSRDFQRFKGNMEFRGKKFMEVNLCQRLTFALLPSDVTDFVTFAQKRLAGNSVIFKSHVTLK